MEGSRIIGSQENRPPATPFANHLLAGLPVAESSRLARGLQAVSLRRGQPLQLVNRWIDWVYFLESGVASAFAGTRDGQIGIAMIGREGVVGATIALPAGRSLYRIVVEVPGRAYRMPTEQFVLGHDCHARVDERHLAQRQIHDRRVLSQHN